MPDRTRRIGAAQQRRQHVDQAFGLSYDEVLLIIRLPEPFLSTQSLNRLFPHSVPKFGILRGNVFRKMRNFLFKTSCDGNNFWAEEYGLRKGISKQNIGVSAGNSEIVFTRLAILFSPLV